MSEQTPKKKKQKTPQQRARNRMIFVLILVLCAIPYIVRQLYILQVKNKDKYSEMAIRQQTSDKLISPTRGDITDRNGTLLATSMSCKTIALDPSAIKEGTESELATDLAELLNQEYDSIYEKAMKKSYMYQLLVRRAEPEVVDAIRNLISDKGYKGINFYDDSKRFYPYNELFSSVIGFTNYDGQGEYGIEKVYDEALSGIAGRVVSAKDLSGHALSMYFQQRTEASDGYTTKLTVDTEIQKLVDANIDQAFEENDCSGVCCVVMDIKTGAILAMAQTSRYDLNSPRTVADEKALEVLKELSGQAYTDAYLEELYAQWRNNITQTPYEPGSVFKIITAAVALEEGSASLNSSYYCGGYSYVDTSKIACWKNHGHGSQTFSKALQNSCNCAFMEIALKTGADKFYSYFKSFGLTEPTGIDLMNEFSPLVGIHYHAYDIISNPAMGGRVTLATYAFGQTFEVSPIQLITAVSAVVNGGNLMKPYIVDSLIDSNGNVVFHNEPQVIRQVISESTSETMCGLIEAVVSTGTGGNAYVAGYRVGGKTGTSEKRAESIMAGKDLYVASFMGIAPCDDPQVAVLVLIDEPINGQYQGGQIAAPVVGRIMKDILPVLGVEAVYSSTELHNIAVKVPLTVGGSVSWAKWMMEDAGFKVKVVGSGTNITAQRPVSQSMIASGSTVVLYAGEEPDSTLVSVPNLKGMTYSQALEVLTASGLYLDPSGALGTTNGTLRVQSQLPSPADGQVEKGSVVSVAFYSSENTGE